MIVQARMNQIGWVHLWHRAEDYDAGEASAHFFNAKTDPLWLETESVRSDAQRAALAAGLLVAIEDPGYLISED